MNNEGSHLEFLDKRICFDSADKLPLHVIVFYFILCRNSMKIKLNVVFKI